MWLKIGIHFSHGRFLKLNYRHSNSDLCDGLAKELIKLWSSLHKQREKNLICSLFQLDEQWRTCPVFNLFFEILDHFFSGAERGQELHHLTLKSGAGLSMLEIKEEILSLWRHHVSCSLVGDVMGPGSQAFLELMNPNRL